jgi:hypothetical protein
MTKQLIRNGDGVRTSKAVAGDTTEYALDLLATLPVVISDTDAVYLYGLDIIAQQESERLYYMHDGLGSARQRANERRCGGGRKAAITEHPRKENGR